MKKFFDKLEISLMNYSLVKMTLSKPTQKNSELRNVYVRPVLLKNKKMFQFTFRYEKRDEAKNLDPIQTFSKVKQLITELFSNATFYTLTEDISLLATKNGKPVVVCKKANEPRVQVLSHDHNKHRIIDPLNQWWYLLGLTTKDGKVLANMQHKFKQICKYVEIVDGIINQMSFEDKIHIADMGAGKGYLTFALYEYMTSKYNKQIIMEGVEIRKDLVQKVNDIIDTCNLKGMQFIESSIELYQPSRLDILIALHACNTATDDAILKGIKNNAKIIICAPCCHKQIRCEMEKSGKTDCITKYGIFLERQAVMITDAIRALVLEYFGYKTQVMEFIETEHTPKNVLIVGRKNGNKVDKVQIANQIDSLLEQYGISNHYLWSNVLKR